jgi:hypothetical protein
MAVLKSHKNVKNKLKWVSKFIKHNNTSKKNNQLLFVKNNTFSYQLTFSNTSYKYSIKNQLYIIYTT